MEYWLAILLSIAVGIVLLFGLMLLSEYIGQLSQFYFATPFILFFFVAILGVIAYQYGIKRQINVSITQNDIKIENYTVPQAENRSFNSDDFQYIHFPESGGQATVNFFGLVDLLAISNERKLCRDFKLKLLNTRQHSNKMPLGNVNICLSKKGYWKKRDE